MTKKVRHWRGRSKTTNSIIKTVNKDHFASAICPTNVEDQKQKFLTYGKTPEFIHRGTEEQLEQIYSNPRSEIRFDLLGEALHILKTVKSKYGDAENYYSEMYGEPITKMEATDMIVDYLKENHLDGAMSVIWCTDLPCSGRMMWQGPNVKYRRPEARKFSMWIKDSKDNNFLRENGIRCLADHEIGTHFFRSFNDGLQPWFADRSRFGIRGLSGIEQLRSEEGLAAVNTILNAKVRYLFGPALLYYIACKATEMTFKQLFEHLAIYVENPDWRWRHCVRVKRGLLNPNDIGGYGKDQCYFEGAVEILRNIDNIDFKVLMCGKICYDEIQRIKKLARLECIQMPAFMRNQDKYKKSLKQIAHMNGLHLSQPLFKAPVAYIRRLKKGRRIGVAGGSNKVRKKGRKGSISQGSGKGMSVSTRGEGSNSEDDDSEICDIEERFYFQQYSLSQGASLSKGGNFLENLKSSSKVSKECLREIQEKSSFDYYKSIVDNLEKKKKEPNEKSKHSKKSESESSSSTVDLVESDSGQSQYRCISRASIHSMLNSRSFSLNSRTGNTNGNAADDDNDDDNEKLQRPNSANCCDNLSTIHLSECNETEVTYGDLEKPHPPTALSAGKVHNVCPVYGNMKPSRRLTPLSTSVVCAQSVSGHLAPSTTSTCQTGTSSLVPAYNVPAPLSKSLSAQNVIKSGTEDSFLYPDSDLLTDDMIQVKTGLQFCDIGSNKLDIAETGSSNQVKLLDRRVKSAANILPKLSN